MALTEEHLLDLCTTYCDIFNLRYFDGVLQYKLGMYRQFSAKRYASFDPKTDMIELNPALCHATIGEIEDILTHELIHVAQKCLKEKVDHGPSFRRIAKDFSLPKHTSRRCADAAVRTPKQMRANVEAKK